MTGLCSGAVFNKRDSGGSLKWVRTVGRTKRGGGRKIKGRDDVCSSSISKLRVETRKCFCSVFFAAKISNCSISDGPGLSV